MVEAGASRRWELSQGGRRVGCEDCSYGNDASINRQQLKELEKGAFVGFDHLDGAELEIWMHS